MRTCVIVNPNAGSHGLFEQLQEMLAGQEEVTCWQTAEAGQARRLAEKAAADGFALVVAAGGDGTVNEVVNGLMASSRRPRLGILPLGTGNDLARTLALPVDPRDAVAVLLTHRFRALDVIRVEGGGEAVYGINVASGGFSGQVDEVLTSELKQTWGPLAYLVGAASVLPNVQNYQTQIAYDDEPPEAVRVLNVIVANGRMAAGGKLVAPHANPEDGLLDVVVVEWGPTLALAEAATRLMTSNYLESPLVTCRRVRRVRVTSQPGMWFNVDGELLTKEPVTFSALPGALEVAVGPGYAAEAA